MILFSLFLILFVVCLVIQKRRMNPLPYVRGRFIQIAMFVFVAIVYLAPDAPRWLVWLLLILAYGFTLVITMYSISRGRGRKK